jgi:hypothetical protein
MADEDRGQLQRDPEDWKTGDEPMTDAQASYLRTLSDDVGEEFDPNMTKADASRRIDELQARSPRLGESGSAGEPSSSEATPPHPSPAEGGTTEHSPRPPRPSQAEGER